MNYTTTPAEVAAHWVAFWTLHKELGDPAYSDTDGARHHEGAEVFGSWARHAPELCWATIVEIWNRLDHSDIETLSVLGAGEVEDLLCNYGDDYFPVIEKFCQVEPDFKTVLRLVWQSSMTFALWQKVQELRGGPNL
jgi:hypothetical protein